MAASLPSDLWQDIAEYSGAIEYAKQRWSWKMYATPSTPRWFYDAVMAWNRHNPAAEMGEADERWYDDWTARNAALVRPLHNDRTLDAMSLDAVRAASRAKLALLKEAAESVPPQFRHRESDHTFRRCCQLDAQDILKALRVVEETTQLLHGEALAARRTAADVRSAVQRATAAAAASAARAQAAERDSSGRFCVKKRLVTRH